MIIQTTKEINGVVYDYTCSDSGMKILRDGVEYDEAFDPAGSGRTYTESDTPIEAQTAATEADYQDALREMGGGLRYDQRRTDSRSGSGKGRNQKRIADRVRFSESWSAEKAY